MMWSMGTYFERETSIAAGGCSPGTVGGRWNIDAVLSTNDAESPGSVMVCLEKTSRAIVVPIDVVQ